MHIDIKTLWNFNACMLDIGAHIDGGYPTYFVTTDGCALSFETAEKEGALIRDALIANDRNSGWHVCAMTVNWEDSALYCEHSGLRIQSAYSEDEANEEAALSESEIQQFYNAYVTCALWSSSDWSDEDENHQFESLEGFEVDEKTSNEMHSDCEDFAQANASDIRDACKTHGYTLENAGHDFWLTRNGHGAGFWDRGLGRVGERLTNAAKVYSGIDLYVGDDGNVHGQ